MLKLWLIAVLVTLPVAARADDWSHTQEFVASQGTSLKVVEPEGYKITVNGRTDTAPAIFPLTNADNYIVMQVVAADGASWERKVEIKAYRQTVVRIRHVKSSAPQQPQKGRSFVGVAANLTHTCKKAADRAAVRFDFVRTEVVASVVLEARSRKDVELPEGQYTVREYRPQNNEWAFAGTKTLDVTKDGWTHVVKCQ